MPHPEKKRQRLEGHGCNNDEAAADNYFQASIESLSGDVLANVFGFLLPVDIMNARLNRKMREAAKITIIPLSYEFVVDSLSRYNFMRVMIAALPNLQKITLNNFNDYYEIDKYVDGEDPDINVLISNGYRTAHDIEIISNFAKLRELTLSYAPLNGRYPCFFNFPLLQKLSIGPVYLKFDLEMLAGLPSLKELQLCQMAHQFASGNLNSLRALKETLEKVHIRNCNGVGGDFMNLAVFPRLKELDLFSTAVTGDIRHIGDKDFPSIEELFLPKGVNGGFGHQFQRISDAHDVIRTLHLLKKQRPEKFLKDFYGRLSRNSPEWYGWDPQDPLNEEEEWSHSAPFFTSFVRAGTRVGYRWRTFDGIPCEVNWLDPEPNRKSTGYGKYMEELQKIEGQVNTFKGFHQPPPQEEYIRLMIEHGGFFTA